MPSCVDTITLIMFDTVLGSAESTMSFATHNNEASTKLSLSMFACDIYSDELNAVFNIAGFKTRFTSNELFGYILSLYAKIIGGLLGGRNLLTTSAAYGFVCTY